MQVSARHARITLLVVVLVLALPLAGDFLARSDNVDASQTGMDTVVANGSAPTVTEVNGSDDARMSDRPTGHLAYVVDAQGPGQLRVIDRATGETILKRTDYELYHDVDPSPMGEQTLFYIASNIRGEAVCPDHLESPCAQDVFARINYSTGERERLFERFVNYNGSSNVHDADRITDSTYLIADIQYDRVYIKNVKTGEIEWTWNAETAFNRSSGGAKNDWTHVNDVEVLDEDLYMVNLRNQDQVVFLDRQTGMLENWTLGADGNHDILYEQHNTDYIPESMGGPAILVADSENDRIVEYQRENGSWNRSWLWTDETLQWPRDADRLPNNNTLVTDSLGTRLLEVTPNGSIVWQRAVPRGVYEAELLSTGAESDGGHSMAWIRGETRDTDVRSIDGVTGGIRTHVTGLFPALVRHGFLYVLPTWVSPFAGVLLLLDLVVVVLWGAGEGGWVALRWYRARS
ncbi:MAG: aryl-sulfate sulfotransferase [Halorhabdus sp.]